MLLPFLEKGTCRTEALKCQEYVSQSKPGVTNLQWLKDKPTLLRAVRLLDVPPASQEVKCFFPPSLFDGEEDQKPRGSFYLKIAGYFEGEADIWFFGFLCSVSAVGKEK